MSEDRTTYIGGPGCATILGVNSYQTPLALWQYLTKRVEQDPPSEIMRAGLRLEPALLSFAGEELGHPVIPGPFVRDGIRGGHIDGLVNATADIVEAKTARNRNGWGEPGTDEIPQGYLVQCLHYLGLMPAQVCWVPVLFSGLDFAMYRVDRNDAVIASMREIVADWWEKHIVRDVPPEPTNGADVSRLFPRDSGRVVIADDAVADAVLQLRMSKAQIKELESRCETLEDRIKLAMTDATTLTVNGDVAITWKAGKPSLRFDSTAFKTAQPTVYQQFCKPVESRRFLIKPTGAQA